MNFFLFRQIVFKVSMHTFFGNLLKLSAKKCINSPTYNNSNNNYNKSNERDSRKTKKEKKTDRHERKIKCQTENRIEYRNVLI